MTISSSARSQRWCGFAGVLLALACLPLATTVVGQTESPDTARLYTVEGVTVTTTRSAVDRSAVPQKLTLITAEDIVRSAATSIADALRRTTPVDVIEFPGLLTGVSIRGFRPQYSGINHRTLVLLDGRPAGTSNLALLHAGGIDRIEILRGPGAALYGANAMGGVINVITRRSTSRLAGVGRVGYGSFGDYEGELTAGGSLGAGFDLDVAFAAFGRASGYETGSRRTFAPDSLRKTLLDGTTTSLPWTTSDTAIAFSEYRATTGRARLGYAFAENWKVDLVSDFYESEGVQNPGDLNVTAWDSRSTKDVARRSAEVLIEGDLERMTPSLRLYHALESVDYYDRPVAPHFVSFRTPTRTFGGQLQDVLRIGSHELTIGFDYTAAEAEAEAFSADGVATSPFSPNSGIHSAAAFAQTRLSLLDGRLTTTGGARIDHVAFHVRDTPHLAGHSANSERHTVLTPNAGVRYSLGAGVQLYGNLGRAFVTPDAFNVAGYAERRVGDGRKAVLVTRGNPQLDPETSRSWDVGLSIRRPDRGLEIDLAYFRTDVRDRIVARTDAPDPNPGEITAAGDTILSVTTYLNVDEAVISGIEAQASYEIRRSGAGTGLRLFAAGTWMPRAEERFVDTGISERIRNVADRTVLGGLDFDDGSRIGGRLTARYVGERVDSDYVAYWEPGEILYPGYLVFDVTGSVRITNRYGLGVELLNLADEDYFEIRGYDMPGRSISITLNATF